MASLKRGAAPFIDYPIITKEVSIRARTKIVLADKMHIELFLRSSDKGRYGANFDGRRFGIGRYDYGKGWVSLAKGDSPGPFGDYFDFEFSAIGGETHADRQRQNVAAESRFELYGGHRRSWRKWEWFVLRCRDSHSDQGSVGCRQAPAIGHYEECPAGRFQQRKVAAERSGRNAAAGSPGPPKPAPAADRLRPMDAATAVGEPVLVWDRLNNRVRYSNRDLEPTSKNVIPILASPDQLVGWGGQWGPGTVSYSNSALETRGNTFISYLVSAKDAVIRTKAKSVAGGGLRLFLRDHDTGQLHRLLRRRPSVSYCKVIQ